MNEAVERLRTAIAGKPGRSFAAVRAADVVTVGAAKPDHPLVKGAAGALADGRDPDLVVHQYADQLAELLTGAA